MYLPQYHSIPENDKFWGKGFTDWVTVRNAKPLYDGHSQPKVPLNKNYYDLSLKENISWQVDLATKYGIDGFAIYHYWFNNETNLLTKPSEIIYENKNIDILYFFAWDNNNWKRSWSNVEGNDWAPSMDNQNANKSVGPQILIPYILGNERDWKMHYDYLLPYFRDSRYVKKDNKPVFVIWTHSIEIDKMARYWDNLAKKDGFAGVYFVYQYKEKGILNTPTVYNGCNSFRYEPQFSGWARKTFVEKLERKLLTFLGIKRKEGLKIYDYDKIWETILHDAQSNTGSTPNHIVGAFTSYDDTPRRGIVRGKVVSGSSPEKFQKYLSQLIKITRKQNKPFIFLTAWNEWGEGAYLEPDEENGYKYLEAVKRARIENQI